MMLLVLAAVEVAAGTGLLRVRRAVVGEGPGRDLVVVGIATIAALVVGTVFRVSGVALAVPVVLGMAAVLWRSRWRSGDVAVLGLIAAAGAACGYQLAATIDPATGSYGDQGALGLALLAVPLSLIAAVSAWRRTRVQR